jgi:hypothetical protein
MDNAVDVLDQSSGFACSDCGALLVENNVFALNRTWPIIFNRSAMVSSANNRTPHGTLVPAYNIATARAVESCFPAAEDALVLAL